VREPRVDAGRHGARREVALLEAHADRLLAIEVEHRTAVVHHDDAAAAHQVLVDLVEIDVREILGPEQHQGLHVVGHGDAVLQRHVLHAAVRRESVAQPLETVHGLLLLLRVHRVLSGQFLVAHDADGNVRLRHAQKPRGDESGEGREGAFFLQDVLTEIGQRKRRDLLAVAEDHRHPVDARDGFTAAHVLQRQRLQFEIGEFLQEFLILPRIHELPFDLPVRETVHLFETRRDRPRKVAEVRRHRVGQIDRDAARVGEIRTDASDRGRQREALILREVRFHAHVGDGDVQGQGDAGDEGTAGDPRPKSAA
jgi:hypothetical protein